MLILAFKQKRIKRKEYTTSADFADDVELVFSNAMAFNQDHTPIWEDALLLRVRLLSPSLAKTYTVNHTGYFQATHGGSSTTLFSTPIFEAGE